MRYDLNTIAYLFIPVTLLWIIASLWLSAADFFQKIAQRYLQIMLIIVFLVLLIDIEYFHSLSLHLNEWLFNYDRFQEWIPILSMVHSMIPFYYSIPAIVGVCSGLLILQRWGSRWGAKSLSTCSSLFRRQKWILWVPLYFILLRGSVGIYALSWGQAYYSRHDFLNQWALNGAFTLLRSSWQVWRDHQRTNLFQQGIFISPEIAMTELQEMIIPSGERIETAFRTPLAQQIIVDPTRPSVRRNIVIILMETFSRHFCGALNSRRSDSPCFDSLARQGILFEHHFSTGARTNTAIPSLLCSFPPLPGTSPLKQLAGEHLPSIAAYLKPFGYQSFFFYGGDPSFDNMEGFLRCNGFDHCEGELTHTNHKWGIPDKLLFNYVLERLDQVNDTPFVSVILTLTNHEPFSLPKSETPFYPPDTTDALYRNTYRYMDQALGEFINQARRRKWFENTIFFITADHGKIYGSAPAFDIQRFHVPALLLTPSADSIEPKKYSAISSHLDLLPTLFRLLNLPIRHTCWGQNLLDIPSDQGRALWTMSPYSAWCEDDYYLVCNPERSSQLFRVSEIENELYPIENKEIQNSLEKKLNLWLKGGVYIFKKHLSKF